MKRRLLMGICSAIALGAVYMAFYHRQPAPVRSAGFADEGAARRLWANAENSPSAREQEHELRVLETSLKQNPDHAPILVRMAQVSRDLGKPAESLRHLQEAVKADPKNPAARLELGRALFESGDVQGAIRETEQLIRLDPGNTDGLYNLGAIYGNLGQDDRAREYWKKAVSIDPDSESGRRAQNALKQLGG